MLHVSSCPATTLCTTSTNSRCIGKLRACVGIVRSSRYVAVAAREPRVVIQLTLSMRARQWTEENLARIGTSHDLGNAAQAVRAA